jgi:hypothetical protein
MCRRAAVGKTHAFSTYVFFVHNIQITKKMHFNIYAVFYSLYSHQHVSAGIAAIFRAMLLLQEYEYKGTNVVSCVAVTP